MKLPSAIAGGSLDSAVGAGLRRRGGSSDPSLRPFDLFQETRGIQRAFQQIGEMGLHQRFDIFLDFGRRPRPGGFAVAAALEMPQVFERLDGNVPQPRQAGPAARTDDAARRGGKELVFGLDFAPAVGALEESGAETQVIEQAHLIVADAQPGFGNLTETLQAVGQQAEKGRVAALLVVGETVEQLEHVGGITRALQVFAQGQVGVQRLDLRHDGDVAPLGELQGDVRKRFHVPGFARTDFARALDDGAQLAALAGVECQHAVGFAPIGVAQHDGFNAEGTRFGHGSIVHCGRGRRRKKAGKTPP